MTQIDRMTMEEKFFSTNYNFSYSGLNKLLFSPRLWYKHYVLQEREERTDKHLIDGKVIHALLLDEKNFNKNFMLLPGNLPTGNTRTVIDKVFNMVNDGSSLIDNKDIIIETLKEINLHQSLKTDEQRVAKIVSDDTDSYWEFLKNKKGKDIIDQDTLDRCKENADLLKANDKISELLRINNTDKKVQVYNEIPIERALENYPFGLKGIIDNIVIDEEKKEVYINDIKTTGKTISDFKETVEYYNYWLQASVYRELIRDMCPDDYKFKFTFIVIDIYQQVYPFEVADSTMNDWSAKASEVLEDAKWHYANRKFNLPIKFEKETVML